MHELCYEEFVRRNPFSDYTFPTVSLAKGRGRVRALRAASRRPDDRGTAAAVPRASASTSSPAAPVATAAASSSRRSSPRCRCRCCSRRSRDRDRLLVDGGVLDNLPVDLLTERDEGPILAVNISMGGGGAAGAPGPPRMPRPWATPCSAR